MSNLSEAQQIEQKLKQYIDNPEPEAKYCQWQRVRYQCYEKTPPKEGKICGAYFVRVAIACEEDSEAGWHYYIESGLHLRIVHEDDILEVV
jgi:hypothetical protein